MSEAQSKALRLGIDLDGVVCDFPGKANTWLANELNVEPLEVDRWDWYKKYAEVYGKDVEPVWNRLWETVVPNGFFLGATAAPGALNGLDVLRAQGHQLVFITSRPATAAEDTEKWLEDHNLGGHHLILSLSSRAKSFTDTDLLLDDKGETVYRHLQLGKPALLFKRRWNRDWWSRVPSISAWDEFVELVGHLAAGGGS